MSQRTGTRPCAFCPTPEAARSPMQRVVAMEPSLVEPHAAFTAAIAAATRAFFDACHRVINRPRPMMRSVEQIMAEHVDQWTEGGFGFDPWTPEGARAFLDGTGSRVVREHRPGYHGLAAGA